MEPVFPGVELCYNEMHLAWCNQDQPAARNVIEINHCRVGRYECSFGENSCCYLAAGDFAVSAGTRKKSASCFPLRHYHGITILLDLDQLAPETRQLMEQFGIELDTIRQYICAGNRCCILRGDPTIEHIFGELYTHRPPQQAGYRKLKVLELLLFLTGLNARERVQQTEYYNQRQVACAKQVAERITRNLQEHQTIEQLAQEAGLSPTALKSCSSGACTAVPFMRICADTGCRRPRSCWPRPAIPLQTSPIRWGTRTPTNFLRRSGSSMGRPPPNTGKGVRMDSRCPFGPCAKANCSVKSVRWLEKNNHRTF